MATALHAVAIHKQLPSATVLLAHGADPNLVGNDGHSVLMRVVASNVDEDEDNSVASQLITLLLKKGANATYELTRGSRGGKRPPISAISIAKATGQQKVLKQLVQHVTTMAAALKQQLYWQPRHQMEGDPSMDFHKSTGRNKRRRVTLLKKPEGKLGGAFRNDVGSDKGL